MWLCVYRYPYGLLMESTYFLVKITISPVQIARETLIFRSTRLCSSCVENAANANASAVTWITPDGLVEVGRKGRSKGWCVTNHFWEMYIYIYNYIYTGWWFGTFFIVAYIENNHPNWLIFFRGVETTNQCIYIYIQWQWAFIGCGTNNMEWVSGWFKYPLAVQHSCWESHIWIS